MQNTFLISNALKSFDFQPECKRDPSGIFVSSTNKGIIMWGAGNTVEESRKDLIKTLRDIAESYFEDFADWYSHNPKDFPYALKIMLSNDEELAQCLNCEICDAI